MRELIRRRLHGDQGGVTLVIVALCLVALVGMIVLVVDVGGLLWNRREMVNASDAAALAAAKTCALPTDPTFPGGPETAADALAAANSPKAQFAGQNITAPVDLASICHSSSSGYVTVQYGANQQLFFAGIFGTNQGHVTTQATAIWGPAGAVNPMPIVIYEKSFQNCKFDAIDPNKTCYVWEDNNNTTNDQSAFGLLDLRTDDPAQYGWGSDAGVVCSDPGGAIDSWITNYPDPSIGDLSLNWPDPTYVCRSGGMKQNGWDDLAKLKGKVLYFPINRCDETLPGNPGGQLLPKSTSEATCPQTPGQYDIIGFFAAELVEVYAPNQVQGTSGTCESDVQINALPNPPDTVSFPITGLVANPGKTCPTSMPDLITSGPTVVKTSGNGQPTGCPAVPAAGCDYSYANGVITWSKAGPMPENKTYRISYAWKNGGACGIPPSGNNSGHCLILQPVNVQIGGSHAGEGDPNSNIRAVKLCEQSLGSCRPVI